MKKVRLKVLDIINRIPSFPGLFVLLLGEKGGEKRRLPVVIGLPEAQSIAFKINHVDNKRPFTHDLFLSFSRTFGIELVQVLINRVVDGSFCCLLIFHDEHGEVRQVDARTSDGVALALRYHCPIYTFDTILEEYGLHDEKEAKINIPLPNVSIVCLKEALKKAVDEENYEWASRLRDEIKQREERGEEKEGFE